MITPLANHGGVLDEPLGKVQAMFDVEMVPETVIEQSPVRVVNATSAQAGPTPEEVFSIKAPGVPPNEGETRARTPISPLEDPRPVASDGPLGPVAPVTTTVTTEKKTVTRKPANG